MKIITNESGKTTKKNVKKKKENVAMKTDIKKPVAKEFEDVQRLVYLLQVHQVELEHQNEELRIAQAELEVSRNKYVNLFDFSPTPYLTLNKEGLIKEVNLSASKLFGIDRSKLINKSFLTYIPLAEKDVFHLFIKSVFESDTKQSVELEVVNKEKTVFHVLLEGLKLDDVIDSELKCQVAMIDLTEYKRIETSLKESNEELKILNNTKDKFFSIVAHDLRSPFQSLLSFSEMLATEIETLSKEEIVLFSKGLNEDLRNLYGLLDNLLHWSMMQRDMLEYNPEDVSLTDSVNKIITLLIQRASKKNISLSNNIKPGIIVTADIDMLRLVINNLLTNAIKFTKPEGQVIINAVERGNFVEVTIQDTGIGIDPEKTADMFNFNSMFTTNGTAGEQGTGLGLPICKEFVERNEGKIWVESELGVGTKFTFTLRKSNS